MNFNVSFSYIVFLSSISVVSADALELEQRSYMDAAPLDRNKAAHHPRADEQHVPNKRHQVDRNKAAHHPGESINEQRVISEKHQVESILESFKKDGKFIIPENSTIIQRYKGYIEAFNDLQSLVHADPTINIDDQILAIHTKYNPYFKSY